MRTIASRRPGAYHAFSNHGFDFASEIGFDTEVLRNLLQTNYEVVTSIERPSIALFGTSFWPEVEIRSTSDGRPLIGIEVKYIRPAQRASKAIAECVGQAVLYRQRYVQVFAYILHYGKSNDRQIGDEAACLARLEEQGIHLVLKRRRRECVTEL